MNLTQAAAAIFAARATTERGPLAPSPSPDACAALIDARRLLATTPKAWHEDHPRHAELIGLIATAAEVRRPRWTKPTVAAEAWRLGVTRQQLYRAKRGAR
jgi:hypothetical protein